MSELAQPKNSLSARDFYKLAIALALYVTSLIASNTLGLKIMPFLFGTHLSVAVFSFPIVFLMTDVVGEVYGKKIARTFVLCGFITVLLFMLYTIISLAVPFAEAGKWVAAGYTQVFGLSLRIALASVLAFAIGEYQDVFTFFFFTKKFEGNYFLLRSTLASIWSQFLDTVIFMTIAFYGVYPNPVLLSIILTWWLYKVLMGFCYTPLSYLGLYLLRKE